jgi:septal ring factor EnvC (AmiA/AmiB activator)
MLSTELIFNQCAHCPRKALILICCCCCCASQASADRQHYQAAVSDLQLQLAAAEQRCEQLEQHLASLADSHAQELEQVRGESKKLID